MSRDDRQPPPPPSPGVPGEGARRWIPALLSALLGAALYAISLGGTYVYDDWDVLGNDARLRDVRQWWRYWTESYNGGVDNLYRPLVSMTYAVQWWLHGVEERHAWMFHAVNVALYAAVCALVAELTRRLASSRDRTALIATAAGLLFAAHPIHVEAAAYIVGRAELMAALGALGALVLFLRRPMTTGRAIAIVGCFLLSLLSKEQGMLVPLLLLFLWFSETRFAHPSQPRTQVRGEPLSAPQAGPLNGVLDYATVPLAPVERRAYLQLVLLLAWGLAGYIVFRESVLKFWWDRSFLDPTIQPMILSRGADRWLMPPVLLGRYTQLLIAPWKLSPDYGGAVIGSVVNVHDPHLYLGCAAVFLWIVLAIWALRRRAGAELFCLLSLAATYVLVGNLFTLIGTNFGERLMFLPSAFFVILIVLLLARLPRGVFVPVAAALIVLGSIRTATYAARWNDRLTFYETSLREQPRSIRLHMLLAHELMERGRLDEAAAVATRGRALAPDYTDMWIQSAVIAMQAGKLDDADAFLNKAQQIKPTLKAAGWQERLSKLRSATTTAPTR